MYKGIVAVFVLICIGLFLVGIILFQTELEPTLYTLSNDDPVTVVIRNNEIRPLVIDYFSVQSQYCEPKYIIGDMILEYNEITVAYLFASEVKRPYTVLMHYYDFQGSKKIRDIYVP